MIQRTLASKLFSRACFFLLYFVAASASFSGYYNKWHFGEDGVSGEDDRFRFEMVVDGTAYRPYVYRQLLPETANWIDRVVPRSFETWLYRYQGGGPEARAEAFLESPTAEDPVYFFRYLIVYAGTFLFALLAVFAMHLVCRAAGTPLRAAVLAPAFLILLVPYVESGGGFFYDYPELAFLALAVWVALRFRWWWIVPVAALGTWNKESFLLFVPTLYPLIRRRSSRLGAWAGSGILCLVCAAVYLPIRMHFADNPGVAMEVHWRDQLNYLLDPRALFFATETTYGIPMLKAFSVAPLALLAWTVARGWRHLPSGLRRHGQIAAAINIPLYLLFCWPGELRDLSMLYVVLLLAIAGNLNDWIGQAAD